MRGATAGLGRGATVGLGRGATVGLGRGAQCAWEGEHSWSGKGATVGLGGAPQLTAINKSNAHNYSNKDANTQTAGIHCARLYTAYTYL